MKTTLVLLVLVISVSAIAQNTALDARVEKFLKEHRGEWRDMNVPYDDGKILHDLIINNKYTAALEIGTSTGHSTIWLA